MIFVAIIFLYLAIGKGLSLFCLLISIRYYEID